MNCPPAELPTEAGAVGRRQALCRLLAVRLCFGVGLSWMRAERAWEGEQQLRVWAVRCSLQKICGNREDHCHE